MSAVCSRFYGAHVPEMPPGLAAETLATGSEAAMAEYSGNMVGAEIVTSLMSAVSVGLVVSSSSGCHVHTLTEGSSVLVSPSPLSDPWSVEKVYCYGIDQRLFLNADNSTFGAF